MIIKYFLKNDFNNLLFILNLKYLKMTMSELQKFKDQTTIRELRTQRL